MAQVKAAMQPQRVLDLPNAQKNLKSKGINGEVAIGESTRPFPSLCASYQAGCWSEWPKQGCYFHSLMAMR